MDLVRRSTSLNSTSDVAQRKLPDLPSEACTSSKMSRVWSSFKEKLTLRSGNSRRLRRSQSHYANSPDVDVERSCHRTSLPYSIYYQLIDNHETMVLPGLRQYPPPVEDDPPIVSPRRCLPPTLPSRNPDYADIDITVNSRPRVANIQTQQYGDDSGPPANQYQDISGISCKASDNTNGAVHTSVGPKMAALATCINSLPHQGWYWGPLNREETERRLRNHPSGSFLVRDSKNEHHLYTLSFKQGEQILHTRIEFVNGLFTFFLSDTKAKETGKPSVEELIMASMEHGVKGEFGDSRRVRGRPVQPPIHIKLEHPVSRFSEVRTLQFLCKFVLRTNMNREDVSTLPLPVHVRSWVHEKQYY